MVPAGHRDERQVLGLGYLNCGNALTVAAVSEVADIVRTCGDAQAEQPLVQQVRLEDPTAEEKSELLDEGGVLGEGAVSHVRLE